MAIHGSVISAAGYIPGVSRGRCRLDVSALIPEAGNSRLVFVNGVYAPGLSAVADLPDGVVVSNLAGLPQRIALVCGTT